MQELRAAARLLGEGPRSRLARLVVDFLNDVRARGRSLETIDFYRTRLGRVLASEAVAGSFLRGDGGPFRAWLVALKEQGTGGTPRPVSDHYVEGHRRATSAFCSWLVAEGHVRRSPLERVGKWKTDEPDLDVLTREEVARLFETQPLTTLEGQRNRAMLAFLYGTGIRVGELVRVEVVSVDLRAGHVRVLGKSRRERRVPLSRRLRAMLAFYLERVRPTSLTMRLFVSAEGLPLSTTSVNHWMTRAARRAKIMRRVYPHIWRHTFATEYLRRGGDPLRLQKILGHSTLKMVMRYVHFAQADIDRAIDELSPLEGLAGGD